MTIVKKDVSQKDGKTYYAFIDETFKPTKSGKAVFARASFCFPNAFVKEAKDSKHKFVSVSADKLLEFLCVSRDKDTVTVANVTDAEVKEPQK